MSPARRSISSCRSASRLWPAASATTRARRRPSDPIRFETSARSAGIRYSANVLSHATILVSTVSTSVPSRSKIHAAGCTRLIAVEVSDTLQSVGLDLYAGPVSRYVAGDWKTIVQQAGEAAGTPVIVMRQNEPADRVTDVNEVAKAVANWRQGLIRSLGLNEEWDEDVGGEYYTDKPDWDGYGAVVLMAA